MTESHSKLAKTVVDVIKDLGFPIAVCCLLFYAIWHFGNILVIDHLDLLASIKINSVKQTEAIEYLADSDRDNKKILLSLSNNQGKIIAILEQQSSLISQIGLLHKKHIEVSK